MLVHRRVAPSIKFAWVGRGIVRVKCLAREHNIMSPARARTQTLDPETSVVRLTLFQTQYLFQTRL